MRRANETHVSFGMGQFIALPNAIGNRSLQDVEENAHHKDENGMSFYLLDHVAVEESGTGSPVVCVHGLGGSSNTWTAMHPSLDAHRFVRMDLPGSGRSALPSQGLSMDFLIECLQTICKRLGITQAQGLIGSRDADACDLAVCIEVVNGNGDALRTVCDRDARDQCVG